jgi:small-conductance mechanosensitive channel
MSSPTIPAGPQPAAPAAAPVKRTRRSDAWTTLFLILTAVLGAWSLVLIVLTLLAILQPAFLYSDAKAALKAAGATVVALIAVEQTYTMGAAMGKAPRFRFRMRTLMRTHRYAGRIALLLAALIAYFCMTDLGAPSSPLRGAIHGFFGSTAFIAIAIKLALLKWRPSLAYDAAPWLGSYAAVAFVIVAITSAAAYYTGNL